MAEDYQDPSQMLNTAQAAHFLGVHKCTLDRWRAKGKGPPVHYIGRLVRYSVGDLKAWRAQQRRIPGSRMSNEDEARRRPATAESDAAPTDAKPAQQTPSPDSSRSR